MDHALPDSYVFGLGYYVGVALFTVVVASLAGRRFSPALEWIDRKIGEWSYFVFLVQWLGGFAVSVTLLHGETRGWTLLIVATPVIVAAGAGLAQLNHRLVEPLRDVVRASSAFRRGNRKSASGNIVPSPVPTPR